MQVVTLLESRSRGNAGVKKNILIKVQILSILKKKTGVFCWVVAAMLVGILTKAVLFPWCPPMVPTTRVSWGKHWGAVVTPAASSRSTQEFNSKALPQGGLKVHQVLAKSILRLHWSPTHKLFLIKDH